MRHPPFDLLFVGSNLARDRTHCGTEDAVPVPILRVHSSRPAHGLRWQDVVAA